MLGFKTHQRERAYVVVQTVMVAGGPELHVSPAPDREAALRIFDAVVDAATPVFDAHSTNRIRVMTADEWARLEAVALGLAEALVGPDDEGKQS